METQLLTLPDFKIKLKEKLKPKRIKHFSKGSKIGNSLLARIRLHRSGLNSHKFAIGQSESPECSCHSKHESSQHYLLDCFLYSCERQILFNQVEHFIPNFLSFNKSKKYEILLNGLKTDNPEFNTTNTSITIAVQKFILKTKRFSDS